MAGCTKADIRLIRDTKYYADTRKTTLLRDRIIRRPLVVSKLKAEDRVEVLSYCCKPQLKGRDSRPPQISKKPESAGRTLARRNAREIFKKHHKFAFKKKAYAGLIRHAKARRAEVGEAGHLLFLGNLSVHDLPVLRRIKRKNLPKDLEWVNADRLKFVRRRPGTMSK